MAQPDTSIPMSVRSFNLGSLADSFMVGKKFQEDLKSQAQSRRASEQGMDLAVKQDTRAQKVHDEELTNLAQTRKEKRRAFLNSMLGEEAEILSGLAPEKRKDYFSKHLVPSLKDDGFDVSDMGDYNEGLIDSWRQLALSPGQRADERTARVKASAPPKSPDPQLKVDETGAYVPVNPATGMHAVTGKPVKAAPQQFLAQGEGGFFTVSAPRGGGAKATPVANPGGPGGQLGPPPKPIPESVSERIRTNEAQKRMVGTALAAVMKLPTSPTSPVKEGVRQMVPFGSAIVDAWDPQGMEARQRIGELSSIVIKAISGAAVTESEGARLKQWIPQVGDTRDQVVMKLNSFQKELDAINGEIGRQYSKDQGYRPDPILNAAPAAGQGKPWERFKK
jgi:hypothetical protein